MANQLKTTASKRGLTPLLLSAALFCFTLFCFAPLNLFLSNQEDFLFSLWDVLPYTALYGLALFIVLSLAGYALRRRARTVYTAIILSLSIALYLQGNLNVDYGVLDGRGIKWGDFTAYAVLNTAIWLAAVAAAVIFAVKKAKLFRKTAKYTAGFLLIVQAGTLAVLLFTTPLTFQRPGWVVSRENATELSGNKNTVVFLLDACDTTYIDEIMRTSPELTKGWDGFTYYPDFVGSYSKTKMSLPFILSGKWYENKQPVKAFLEEAYASVPLFDTLIDANYDIGLYTNAIYLDGGLIGRVSNLKKSDLVINDHFALAAQMMRFSSFSFAPHIFKPCFEFYSGAFNNYFIAADQTPVYINDNYIFADIARQTLTKTDAYNAFRFFHMTGAHLPCNMDAAGNYVGEWNSTPIEQTKGAILSVNHYMEQMKSLGVYDDATIIILSDHGRFDEGVAFPTFLIKAPNAHGAVKTSAAAASQAELHATILDAAGFSIPAGETSILRLDEQADARRRYLYYPTTYANGGYLPDLIEYEITRGLQFEETGRVFTKDGVKSESK